MAATIFVVDDHDVVRTALRQWLEAEFPHYQVTEFVSAEGVLARTCFQVPDLVIMDMGFSLHDGIVAIRRLKALAPEIPIVIVTILDDDKHCAEAMDAGAAAFISTRTMYAELIPLLTMFLSKIQV